MLIKNPFGGGGGDILWNYTIYLSLFFVESKNYSKVTIVEKRGSKSSYMSFQKCLLQIAILGLVINAMLFRCDENNERPAMK